jgi:hypothetical protein
MIQPGPGGVLRLDEEVRSSWPETKRTDGFRSALGWVLGRSNEHPVTSRSTKGKAKPPNMREIRHACRGARIARRKAGKAGARAPHMGPSSSADYYKGVVECLYWISVGGSQPHRR